METELKERISVRYRLPDSVRGICVVGMVLYHTLFDVMALFAFEPPAAFLQTVEVIRDLGAACFVFLSGFTFLLGRHHLKRGLILSAAGIVITAATYVVMPDSFVIFGILTFMGAACLLMIPCEKALRRIPPLPGIVISLALFMLLFECNYGYIGYYSLIFLYRLPADLYKNYLTAFFGFPFPGFVSGDYFGLFPWIFIYITGYFSFRAAAKSDRAGRLLLYRIPVFEKIGRYSLYVYLIHQPVIYFIVWAASRAFS